MKPKNRLLVCCLMCGLLAFALSPFTVQAGDKVYRLKAESVYGPMSASTSVGLFNYLDLVEKKSKGRIKFTRFSSGALAKAKEALDAVEVGMIDAIISYPPYYAGHIPEGQIFWTPFLFKSMQNIYDVYYNTEVGSLLRQSYEEKGSILVGPQILGTNIVATRNKVSTLAELKGMKLRSPGGLGVKVTTAMGASPVMLVGSEIYTGLQRGTIDGYIYPLYSTWDYKLYEQVKYLLQPSLGYIVTYIWFSKKAYDSLPPDLKKVVMDAGKEHAQYCLNYAKNKDVKLWQDLKGKGAHRVDLNEVDTKALINNMRTKVWPSYEANARCKKIMNICLEHEGWK